MHNSIIKYGMTMDYPQVVPVYTEEQRSPINNKIIDLSKFPNVQDIIIKTNMKCVDYAEDNNIYIH